MQLPNVKKLIVQYNGRVVGYLADLKGGKIGFQYDGNWIKNGFSISPLSLPLGDVVHISEKQTFDGLFGVFWDSLPDGWGELLVRRMLRKRGINFEEITPLQKLSIVNESGLGALEYEPNHPIEATAVSSDLDLLAQDAAKILRDEGEPADLDALFALGGSSGGARPKAHIRFEGEDWIVKFPCAIDPPNAGKREFTANALAKKCGIDVNEHRLFPSARCSGYFGAKRFDRTEGGKRHVVSLAALLETTHRLPNLDYGHLFQVISIVSANRERDLYEAFRRMTFNALFQNKDDHSKNFAFLYDEAIRGYRLSPAYDLTSLPNKTEHEMTVGGNGSPTEADLLALARDFDLSQKKCEEIILSIRSVLGDRG